MEDIAETTTRKQRGKPFPKGVSGNPDGRPKGSLHKATLAAQILLDGEAEALTRKAVELALAGDITALRLCLERILPARRERPVSIDLPSIASAKDVVAAQSELLKAIGAGDITPQEGAVLCGVVESIRRSIETQDIETRIAKLEKAQGERK